MEMTMMPLVVDFREKAVRVVEAKAVREMSLGELLFYALVGWE